MGTSQFEQDRGTSEVSGCRTPPRQRARFSAARPVVRQIQAGCHGGAKDTAVAPCAAVEAATQMARRGATSPTADGAVNIDNFASLEAHCREEIQRKLKDMIAGEVG